MTTEDRRPCYKQGTQQQLITTVRTFGANTARESQDSNSAFSSAWKNRYTSIQNELQPSSVFCLFQFLLCSCFMEKNWQLPAQKEKPFYT